jgi:hypothetical protein
MLRKKPECFGSTPNGEMARLARAMIFVVSEEKSVRGLKHPERQFQKIPARKEEL